MEIKRQTPALIDVPQGCVRILESHHAKDFRMDMAEWGFHKLAWVAVGSGVVEFPDQSISIQRDDVLMLPASVKHRFVDSSREPLTLIILCISKELLNERQDPELGCLWDIVLSKEQTLEPRAARTTFYRHQMVSQFRAALREQENHFSGWESALSNIVNDLLLRIIRGEIVRRDNRKLTSLEAVEGAIEFLDNNFQEPQRLNNVADRCGLSTRRFTELFKTRTGMTFSQYLNKKRIAFACTRLKDSRHILYACYESGFGDLAYFYRVFKKQTGLTPKEYLDQWYG